MSATTPMDRVLDRLDGARRAGEGWSARCPAHDDRTPSLSICEGEDGRALIHCHAGCETQDVLVKLGLSKSDLFPPANSNGHARRIVETYGYVDEIGELLFEVVRFEPKDFRQRRPTGTGWTWKLGDVRRVLYRLPEVIEAIQTGQVVYLVEGEKDVHALERAGGAAVRCCSQVDASRPASGVQPPRRRSHPPDERTPCRTGLSCTRHRPRRADLSR